MANKTEIMEGCRQDILDLTELFHTGLRLMPKWSETTFENRVLSDINFLTRLKRGRVSPRKMRLAEQKLTEFIKEHEKA